MGEVASLTDSSHGGSAVNPWQWGLCAERTNATGRSKRPRTPIMSPRL